LLQVQLAQVQPLQQLVPRTVVAQHKLQAQQFQILYSVQPLDFELGRVEMPLLYRRKQF
jgi:hypothetical protein